ncbi:MAG: hypothetical protein AB7V26_10700 [Lysobacterales bacterium]
MLKIARTKTRPWRLPVYAALLVGGLVNGQARAGTAQFFDLSLPFPEATDSVNVSAVSADGQLAVGHIDTGPGLSFFPVVWDLSTGFGERLPEPAGAVAGSVVATGIKDDNGTTSVIVGVGANSVTSGQRVMVRWLDAVPEIPAGAASSWSEGFGLSGDGEVIVGRTRPGADFLPGRWDPINGLQSMSPLAPGTSGATVLAASFDGSVMAGWSPGPFGGTLPAWWDAGGGAHFPQFAALNGGGIVSVSGDGQWLGGQASVDGFGLLPTLWNTVTGAHRFLSRTVVEDANGILAGGKVTAMSPDGQVLGLLSREPGIEGIALWTEAGGLRNLKQLLELDHGLDLSQWRLSEIKDIAVVPGDASITVVGTAKFFPDPNNPSVWQDRAFSANFPPWPASAGTFPQFCDVDWQAPAVLAAPGLRIMDQGNMNRGIGLIPDPAWANTLVPFNGELYAIGNFTEAGGVDIGQGIARWNGSRWAAVGSSLSGPPSPFLATDATVFDDGNGPALYVAGDFFGAGAATTPGLARWDGSQWSNVGQTGLAFNGNGVLVVRKLMVYDDGNGPALYASGNFNSADGIAVNGLARWDGQAWSSIGSPDDDTTSEEAISSMAVYDDGSGPALYIAGSIRAVAGVPALHLAKWNGQAWSAVGAGVFGFAQHMVAFDDGSGPALYMSDVTPADGTPVTGSLLRWNGQQFQSYGHLTSFVTAMAVLDDGQGPALWIAPASGGGGYADFDGAPLKPVDRSILRWDGNTLSRFGKPNESMAGFGIGINSLAEYDDGSGPKVYFGGDIDFIVDEESNGAIPAENIGRIARCVPPSPLIFVHGFED